jgi:hypothetical protein
LYYSELILRVEVSLMVSAGEMVIILRGYKFFKEYFFFIQTRFHFLLVYL